jgi:hypothetical protein
VDFLPGYLNLVSCQPEHVSVSEAAVTTGVENSTSRIVWVAVIGIAVAGASLAFALSHNSTSNARAFDAALTSQPNYPDQDEVAPSDVDRKASFTVYHPNVPTQNDSTMSHAWVLPDKGDAAGSVVMMYPLPDSQSCGVRQPFLSVAEEPWPYGDPDTFIDRDVADNPSPDKFRCDFNNVPAVCVRPNSADDATQENPAYVHLNYNGVSIELMGGNNLQQLLGIAHSVTRGGNHP